MGRVRQTWVGPRGDGWQSGERSPWTLIRGDGEVPTIPEIEAGAPKFHQSNCPCCSGTKGKQPPVQPAQVELLNDADAFGSPAAGGSPAGFPAHAFVSSEPLIHGRGDHLEMLGGMGDHLLF